MSIVGDILNVTKDLEGRAKDRRDIDELRQIQSLALTLQSQHVEVVERDLRVMQEIAEVKAQNAKLQAELAQAKAEDIRISGGVEFRRGARTGNQWLPFCAKCHSPAVRHQDNFLCCSDGNCGWMGGITS